MRPGRGHYESYYLRALDPSRPRGVWIRYTVLVTPEGRSSGQLWCTLFDREAGAPRAVRMDLAEPQAGEGAWIRLGAAVFGPEGATGEAVSAGRAASWELTTRAGDPTLLHLPRPWMYEARLPRTKLLSLTPSTSFDGVLRVDGEEIPVAGWPGMVGHNWGEEHAARWIWLHGLRFDAAGPDTWLDVAIGRVRLGPVTTPWIANGALSLDGERLALGGLGRRSAVTATESSCVARLPGRGVTVTASISAPPAAFARWDYAGPAGSTSDVVNCSVADLTVRVERPGRETVELTAPGRAVYELGREA